MEMRRFMQITAGVLAGAALVGVPTLAVAGQNEEDAKPASDMSTMMSDSQGPMQMMDMMSDPEMRSEMRSMMSDAMKQMPGMGDQMSGEHRSEMGQMHGLNDRAKSNRSEND